MEKNNKNDKPSTKSNRANTISYEEVRERNNKAVKKSRNKKDLKHAETEKELEEKERENEELKKALKKVVSEYEDLKSLFRGDSDDASVLADCVDFTAYGN